MSNETRIMAGIILLTIPTIEFGGTFLLSILRGGNAQGFSDMQRSFFRAGHAHAGVLVILALICQPLVDTTTMSSGLQWFVRLASVVAALLVSGGFFFAVMGNGDKPNGFIRLIYAGAALLAVYLIVLGIGLLTAV